MKNSSHHIAGMFLLLFLITLWVLPPFSQADIPVGVSQTQYYQRQGIGPVIEIPHPGTRVEINVVKGPALYYSNVLIVGNLLLNILTLYCAVFFWKIK